MLFCSYKIIGFLRIINIFFYKTYRFVANNKQIQRHYRLSNTNNETFMTEHPSFHPKSFSQRKAIGRWFIAQGVVSFFITIYRFAANLQKNL